MAEVGGPRRASVVVASVVAVSGLFRIRSEQRVDRTQHSSPRIRDIAPTDEYTNHDKCAEKLRHILLTRNAE